MMCCRNWTVSYKWTACATSFYPSSSRWTNTTACSGRRTTTFWHPTDESLFMSSGNSTTIFCRITVTTPRRIGELSCYASLKRRAVLRGLLAIVLLLCLRFVKCRGIAFAQPVHRDRPPQMGHHYAWGSKQLNMAYTSIYAQYTGTTRRHGATQAFDEQGDYPSHNSWYPVYTKGLDIRLFDSVKTSVFSDFLSFYSLTTVHWYLSYI